jgi:predicted transposase YbfD/YdcC
LLAVFNAVPDPRKRRGRSHGWQTIWTVIAAALASACQTPAAIARWAKEHQAELLAALPPAVSRLPSEATVRRALAQVDVVRLDAALRTLPDPSPPATPLLDEHAPLRGVTRDGHPCQLVARVAHGSGAVLGQTEVARKRDERSAVPVLLAEADLRGKVITLDALHTLKRTAQLILDQQGDYLLVVKKNQGALYDWLETLFTLPPHPADHEVWDQVGPVVEKQHGRIETRTLICGNAHIEDVAWPGVQQVVRRECERITVKTGKRTHEVSYAITSVAVARGGATELEALWRGHWTIENRLHYVRDVSLGEDAGHAAQGATAHALASLRNALLYLFRRAGWRSVPDALAHYGASVVRALTLIGLKVNI